MYFTVSRVKSRSTQSHTYALGYRPPCFSRQSSIKITRWKSLNRQENCDSTRQINETPVRDCEIHFGDDSAKIQTYFGVAGNKNTNFLRSRPFRRAEKTAMQCSNIFSNTNDSFQDVALLYENTTASRNLQLFQYILLKVLIFYQ